jgi:hypothetical protein
LLTLRCNIQVKLNLYLLEGIRDDIDFCCKLAKEESVILCPGSLCCIFFLEVVYVKQCLCLAPFLQVLHGLTDYTNLEQLRNNALYIVRSHLLLIWSSYETSSYLEDLLIII